ncbi:baseplate J/gp47 family protein [Corallococcus llansteffanensis]|uniref:Uncharacterized protein n=1 Tax=Corallococcus llansteffanensis TaxID=2316731 RepID=A0A3A8QTT5_9BACT|nr:baseplate J/gp47 family protein [Corallococcus llansteffanensis]RKH68272.1 hypothetical protein D7V93_01520 [Corallococcus llansteffanensis]
MDTLFSSDKNSFSAIVDRLLGSFGARMDTTPGSVLRILTEAYAREMATFYATLELAHRAGYLDTAEGDALDNVVELLGIRRARAGLLLGKVELRRSTPAPGDIDIPAGWRVTGVSLDSKPLPIFEALEDAVLRRGETRVVVPVQQAQEDTKEAAEFQVINPGSLTVMPRPLPGIEAVTNPEPLQRHSEDETDDSLRARARAALRDTSKGTLEALAAAVREQGVQRVTVQEPSDGPPGVVEVIISDAGFEQNPEAVQRVEKAIRLTKAAGIRAQLRYARSIYLQPEFLVEPSDPELDAGGFERLAGALRDALASFIETLQAGENVSRRRLEAVLFAHPGVRQVSELQMKTFVRAPSGKGGFELVAEDVSREYGAARDWRMDALQKATFDLKARPPRISRLRPPVYRLHLVVSRSVSDRRPAEAVQQAIRSTLEEYEALLAGGEKAGNDKPEIVWPPLEAALKQGAGVVKLLSLVVTTTDGATVTLTEKGAPYPTAKTPRLVLASVETMEQA